ncbi:hypothetical protein ACTFIY_005743 [Dictyostelium cf. discoideum]
MNKGGSIPQISKQFCDNITLNNINNYFNNKIIDNNLNKKFSYFIGENGENIIYPDFEYLIVIDSNNCEKKNLIKSSSTNDIINSFVVNDKRSIGASSHYSKESETSVIVIWDLISMKQMTTIQVSKGFNEILVLQFNLDSSKLAGLANDEPKFTIFIWDIKQRSIIISSPSTYRVKGIQFNPFNMHNLLTFGDRHINFWTLNETMISKKKASFGKEFQQNTIIHCCYVYSFDTTFFGTSDGNILVFKANNLIQIIKLSPNNQIQQPLQPLQQQQQQLQLQLQQQIQQLQIQQLQQIQLSPILTISPYNSKDERKIIQLSIQQLLLQQQQQHQQQQLLQQQAQQQPTQSIQLQAQQQTQQQQAQPTQPIQQQLQQQQQQLSMQTIHQQLNGNIGNFNNSGSTGASGGASASTSACNTVSSFRKSGFFVAFENLILFFSSLDSFKNPKPIAHIGNNKRNGGEYNDNNIDNVNNNNNNNNNSIVFMDSFEDRLVILDKNNKQYQIKLPCEPNQIGFSLEMIQIKNFPEISCRDK